MNIKNLPDKALQRELQKQVERDKAMETVRNYGGDDRVVDVKEVLQVIQNKPKEEIIPSGYRSLDAIIGGFKRGEVIVVSGPTGMGKTTLLQSLTYNFADAHFKPLWFSYEVTQEDLIQRFGESIPSFALPLETVPSSVKWLEARIWEGLAKFNTEIVFIDHLHFLMEMGHFTKGSPSTSGVIGHIMRQLKTLALKTNTVIFLVSHITKTNIDEPPTISDLRDSSFIGQEADTVILVWREVSDTQRGNIKEYTNRSYVKVDKARRTGRLSYTKMWFDGIKFVEEI